MIVVYPAKWTPDWDLASIPEKLLLSEAGRRIAAVRKRQGYRSNPVKLKPCPHCGQPKGTAELRFHKPICFKTKLENERQINNLRIFNKEHNR